MVFLDGLHEAKQTYRDLLNALEILKPGGVILVDDVLPKNEVSAMPSQQDAIRLTKKLGLPDYGWFGDVYKVLGAITSFHPELSYTLLKTGEGHAQALVWRNERGPKKYSLDEKVLSQLDSWKYRDFFPTTSICRMTVSGTEKTTLQSVLSSQRY